MTSAVLFDLDGTLVDTAPDIYAAAKSSLKDLNLPIPSFEEARSYIGDGMPRFIKRLLTRQWWGEPDIALFNEAKERMMLHYDYECVARLMLYDGVIDTLNMLKQKKIKMACVTNKPQRFAHQLIDACHLQLFFDSIICGDTLSVKKPDPMPLLEAIKTLDVSPENTVMIGDSNADSQASQAANIRFIAVSYGYHRNGVIPEASAIAHHFAEIMRLI